MTQITASEVNQLRQSSGAGMMDCKKALVEANGDMEAAVDLLRKKGQKVAADRGNREAKEGYIIAATSEDGKTGAVVALNCETDFVARNEEFQNYAAAIVELAVSTKANSTEQLRSESINGSSVEEGITSLIGKIGEKVDISQLKIVEAEKVIAYNHPGNRLASIVGLNQSDAQNLDEIGKDIAMQIAAMNPVAIDQDDVPQDIIDREINIGMEQAREAGKPEEMIEKIAMGKLNKFYKENTLLNQEFIKDSKKSIKQVLSEVDSGLSVTSFGRSALS
ncbi:MAG TPA: elongation factor Ts [Flavobacteriales bacterium]|nr:elongation factor Ts [Flavobacteriales bacterium]HIA11419.1 elongation factor Ts [Flavobacteriales bacterium]